MRTRASVVIAAPAEKIFEQWTDVERFHEWVDPVIQRRKFTDGPVRVGSRFRAVDQWPGRRVEFTMEVTEYEENKRFGARWYKPMEAAWTSQLVSTPDGTRVDFEIELKPPLLMRLFNPFLKLWIETEARAMMASFKARVEQALQVQLSEAADFSGRTILASAFGEPEMQRRHHPDSEVRG